MTQPGLSDAAHLLLVGDPDSAINLAAEMARGGAGALAVYDPCDEALEKLRCASGDLVMIDVPVNLPDVLARLRGGQRETGMIEGLVGRTVADVERALILETLAHCHGNRTTAATVLGISVRTMRNKLKSFIEDGVAVAPAP